MAVKKKKPILKKARKPIIKKPAQAIVQRNADIPPYLITDGVTQSLLGDYIDCRQRAKNKINGWESGAPRDPLVFGSFFHWLTEVNYDLIRQDNGAVYDFKALAEKWMVDRGSKLNNQQKAEEFIAMAEALYNPYWEFWKEDFKRDWVGVESKFDVNFHGYRLRGMRDGLYRQKKKPWLLETKTASGIDEKTLDELLAFDWQCLYYLTGSQIELDESISGVLYNIVKKPGFKFYTKKNPTLPDWVKAVDESITAEPEKYFARFELTFSQKRRKNFERDLLIKLDEFNDWLDGKIPTYKNEKACKKRWNCEYMKACANDSFAGYYQTAKLFSELD